MSNISIKIIKENKRGQINELNYKETEERASKRRNILKIFKTLFDGNNNIFLNDTEWLFDSYDRHEASVSSDGSEFTVTFVPFELTSEEVSKVRRRLHYSKIMSTMRSYFDEEKRLTKSSGSKRALWNSFNSFVLENSKELTKAFAKGDGFPKDGKIQFNFKWSEKVEKDFGFSSTMSDYNASMRMRSAAYTGDDNSVAPNPSWPSSK